MAAQVAQAKCEAEAKKGGGKRKAGRRRKLRSMFKVEDGTLWREVPPDGDGGRRKWQAIGS